jgi:radical SAM protein with 4Fe4S-binding SPASM domain
MNPTKTDIIRRLDEAGLKSPRAVTIAITNQCNMLCRHCLLNSGPDEKASLIPKNQVSQLIHDFSTLGAEKFTITGGEPLTHPDWAEVVNFACSQPGVKEVRLQTNATLMTSLNLDTILFLKNRGIVIQTSLEGSTAAIHDRVRGAGSFERTMQGLRLLEKSGMAARVCITFTEMKHNFEDIPDLLRLADKMGIGQFVTGTLVWGGRAAQSDDLAPPTPAQYEKLLRHYQKDKIFRDSYHRIGNIAALEWDLVKNDAANTCCTFIETPYVTTQGYLYPCVMLHADNFAATDIYKHPLAAAIAQKIDSWSQLQRINHSRLSGLDTCQDCPYYRSCGAGCMGRAYLVHGDFFTAEDRCGLRKAVYRWRSGLQKDDHP